MTDRVNHLVVALDKDIRKDDVEALVNAIKMMHWVAGVELGITSPSDFVARQRVGSEVSDKLYDIIKSLR